MKMLHYFSNEMKQIVCGVPFWICCLLVMILETTAGFCIVDGNELSVIEVILQYSVKERESNMSFNSFSAFRSGMGSWLLLFAPVITALPFVVLFRDEASSGYRKFRIISMKDKKCFSIIKYVSCFFSGALTMLVGTLLFAVVTEICFPSIKSFGSEYMEMVLSSYHVDTVLLVLIKYLVSCFFYGGFWALMSFVLLGKIQNKYLIVGIPFMIKYMWREIYFKSGNKGVGPDSLMELIYGEQSTVWIVFTYAVLGIISFILFYVSTVKKEDISV